MIIDSVSGVSDYNFPGNSIVSVVQNTVGYVQQHIINEYSVMTVPAFWRGVRFISETMAGIPKYVYLCDDDGDSKVEHPLNGLLNQSISPIASPFTNWQTYYHHTTVWGNGYNIIQRGKDANRTPTALLNLSPEIVTPFITGGQKYFFIEIEDTSNLPDIPFLEAINSQGQKVKGYVLTNDDVAHIMLPGFTAIKGYPLVWLMRETLQGAKDAERHAAKYHRKGGFIRGSLEFPNALSPEQLNQMRASLEKYKNGRENEFDYLILQMGGSLKNSTIPLETAQLIESRQFNIIEIAQMLSIPPYVLYQSQNDKFANVEQAALDVVKYSLSAWIIRSEQELTLKLLSNSERAQGYRIHFDLEALTRGDAKTRTDNVIALVNNGLMLPNEGCKRLGIPSLGDEGERLRVPVNVSAPLDTLDLPKGAEPGVEPTASANAPTDAPNAAEPPSEGNEATASNAAARIGTAQLAGVLAPLVEDASRRIDLKTSKALESKADKPQGELTIWGNVFAEQQANYVRELFAPINSAATSLGGSIDVERIALRYGNEIKRSIATKENRRELAEIVKEITTNG